MFVVISHFFARAFYHVSAFFFSKKVIAQFIKNTMQRYNQHVNAICVFWGEFLPKFDLLTFTCVWLAVWRHYNGHSTKRVSHKINFVMFVTPLKGFKWKQKCWKVFFVVRFVFVIWVVCWETLYFADKRICPLWGLNSWPLVYETSALPLS